MSINDKDFLFSFVLLRIIEPLSNCFYYVIIHVNLLCPRSSHNLFAFLDKLLSVGVRLFGQWRSY